MVNVPSLSERTLRRDIAESGYVTGPQIQVEYYLFSAVLLLIIKFFVYS